MLNLDVYYCVYSGDEFAVEHDKEAQFCPFCQGEITFSHTIDQDVMSN